MEEYTLKVTPETLISVSGDVLTKISKTQNAFAQISNLIVKTSEHWEGEGQTMAMKHYRMRKDEYERVFRALIEHINKLQGIAGVYKSAERQNESIAEILPSDVII